MAAAAAVLPGCDDDADAGASCAQVCPNVMAAKCENDPDCMATCNKIKDSTPMGCTEVYNALTRCYVSAKFTCDDDKQSVAKDCSKQERAYAECLAGGGTDGGAKDSSDAGDDESHGGGTKGTGTGGTKSSGSGMKGSGVTMLMHLGGGTQTHDAGAGAGGNDGSGGRSGNGGGGSGGTTSGNDCSGEVVEGACDQCILAACCDEAVVCQNDADCITLEECVAQCSDSDCVQGCANSSSSSAIDVYNTLITCATEHCQSICSDDAGTGAGGSDVGAPNDGNEGHASATTPPDCLEVPSDVTGYCGDLTYKVIYDCPDGPPYADCDLNTMSSSGVYCCGH
jgi:hypothetical protein